MNAWLLSRNQQSFNKYKYWSNVLKMLIIPAALWIWSIRVNNLLWLNMVLTVSSHHSVNELTKHTIWLDVRDSTSVLNFKFHIWFNILVHIYYGFQVQMWCNLPQTRGQKKEESCYQKIIVYFSGFTEVTQFVTVSFAGEILHLWRPCVNTGQMEFTRATRRVVVGKQNMH